CYRDWSSDVCSSDLVLLVAERNHAQACGLCHAGEVGDRDTRQTEDRVDAVELEGIDDQMKAVGHFLYVARLRDLRFNGSHTASLERFPHLRGDAGPARRQKISSESLGV